MRARLALIGLLGAIGASPAGAERAPAYGQPDAQFAADAASLKAGEIAAMPGRGGFDLVLEDGGKLDRRMMMLGIYCRAWKVANPLSAMVARALGSWDRDGQLGGVPTGPTIRFRATHALATMRCVEVKEMKTRCLTRTAIDGEATIVREGVPRALRRYPSRSSTSRISGCATGLRKALGFPAARRASRSSKSSRRSRKRSPSPGSPRPRGRALPRRESRASASPRPRPRSGLG